MQHPDRAIEAIARRQYGAFTTAQARSVGHTDDSIRHRLRMHAWERCVRGVYVLNAIEPTWFTRLMAAVLHKRRSTVAARAAMTLHELAGFRPCRPELVVPSGANHSSPLAIVHRSDDIEVTTVANFPVVTATQALFDVAGTVPFPRLLRAAEDAMVRGLVDPAHLAARFDHLEPQLNHGIGDMRRIVEIFCRRGVVPARSELEALMFGLLDELGLDYVRQVPFPWRLPTPMTVDATVPSLWLITEADGREWHARMEAFHTDRQRDLVARAHGYETVRLTYPMLTSDRRATLVQLRDYIQRRSQLMSVSPRGRRPLPAA